MGKSKSSCAKSTRQLDMFGAKVGLNYKGNETYGTVVGGLCSVLYQVLVWTILIR